MKIKVEYPKKSEVESFEEFIKLNLIKCRNEEFWIKKEMISISIYTDGFRMVDYSNAYKRGGRIKDTHYKPIKRFTEQILTNDNLWKIYPSFSRTPVHPDLKIFFKKVTIKDLTKKKLNRSIIRRLIINEQYEYVYYLTINNKEFNDSMFILKWMFGHDDKQLYFLKNKEDLNIRIKNRLYSKCVNAVISIESKLKNEILLKESLKNI